LTYHSSLRYIASDGQIPLWIILPQPGRNTPLQSVNGHSLGCGYRLAWIVIRGTRYL